MDRLKPKQAESLRQDESGQRWGAMTDCHSRTLVCAQGLVFYSQCPASCLLHVFFLGRPPFCHPTLNPTGTTDGSTMEDCVRSLNDRPVHTSCLEPLTPHPTRHKQLDCITGLFFFSLFGSSVPWFTRQTDMTKDLSDRTSDYWAGMS